jgi:hypothetical protein
MREAKWASYNNYMGHNKSPLPSMSLIEAEHVEERKI